MTRTTDADTTPTRIPRAIEPRLWRAVVRLPGNPRTGTLFGPGYASAREAHQWLIDRRAGILGPTGRRKRGQAGLPARWREKRSHIALCAETPLLDRGDAARRRIQKRLRAALIPLLRRMGRQEAESPAETLAQELERAVPGILDPLIELAGPERDFERMTTADARAIAACTLVGAGPRLRETLEKRNAPRAWTPARRAGSPWNGRTLAAVMDWRNSRDAWPQAGDEIGPWHEERLQRTAAAAWTT